MPNINDGCISRCVCIFLIRFTSQVMNAVSASLVSIYSITALFNLILANLSLSLELILYNCFSV